MFGKIFADKIKDIGLEAQKSKVIFFLCCLHAISILSLSNGDRAHYVMVSKLHWKPFWHATQLYPQNDWTRWQNGVNETHAHGPHCDMQTRVTSEKVCLRFGQCRSLH